MAEGEKKGFFGSKAFKLILVWIALGIALTVAIYSARPSMKHACEQWEAHVEEAGHGEHGEEAALPDAGHAEEEQEHGEEGGHGDDPYHACHVVAQESHGFTANLAAAFHAISGNPLGTAWNLPNFLILITIIVHFFGPGLNEQMKTRREDLEKAIDAAEKAKAEAVDAKEKYETKLKKLDDEIYDIKQDMRKQGEKEKDRIVEQAKELAERIKNEADFTAKQEILVAQYRLREDAAKLAVEVAEKVIKQAISEQDRDRLINEYLEKVMEQRQ